MIGSSTAADAEQEAGELVDGVADDTAGAEPDRDGQQQEQREREQAGAVALVLGVEVAGGGGVPADGAEAPSRCACASAHPDAADDPAEHVERTHAAGGAAPAGGPAGGGGRAFARGGGAATAREVRWTGPGACGLAGVATRGRGASPVRLRGTARHHLIR